MGSHPIDPDPPTRPDAPWPTPTQLAALAAFAALFCGPIAVAVWRWWA